ncbi:colicin V production CvpA [Meridianimarinicoccus roseus]|jgi:membrane protein required for colicin V production|uniref:Colicin V production CvpA n=1 Tax=Meridianimarinicoccus roseus TaxID=2072018 RepID=A0A2V2L888_9RHOB|nr:CvpA family protein [Meridianimarinicoccus roseus]PWR01638.1 colicin V production CvpA [Meridianimarinicoccus roseus]
MDGFTIVDGVVAAVIVVSALLAYSRGFVREAMAIAGWIAAAILAFLFAAQAEPLVKEIPYVGDFLRGSCELSIIAAFSVVFALALVVVSLFTPLFSTVVQRSALGGLDQGAGFVFGALRGILLVAVALIVYDRVVAGDPVPMIEASRTAQVFSGIEEDLNAWVPEDAPGWILLRYEELVGSCGADA